MKRTSSALLVMGISIAVLIGCASDPEPEIASTSPTVAPNTEVPAPAAAKPGDQTQAGLEATLNEQYIHLQQGDWAGMYGYLSPRCRNMHPQDSVEAQLDSIYEGRDFSGGQQYLITMNGPDLATVVIKSFDGKGNMQPSTWSYISGAWVNDAC
ncbi:hypothetical protein [Rhodococcus qingshengii]|uniref:hypothetical protein n=1 Tax=Rhodococcus qingshengii TaxID=334542 RepID=UPI001C8B8DBC|nr:hypothetical protein [Rhodococcus qingshengii]MBX9147760.1 hypothetical protein [Rhodococcus qingshengii]